MTVKIASRFVKNLHPQISQRIGEKLFKKINQYDTKSEELNQKYESYLNIYKVLNRENRELRK